MSSDQAPAESAGATPRSRLSRALVLGWAALAYGLFVVALVRFVGFVAGIAPWRHVDAPPTAPFADAVWIDLLLVGAFGLQHSVMARPWFKRLWERALPRAAERSTCVAFASLLLLLLTSQWRAVPALVWEVEVPLLRALVWSVAAFGWTLVVGATFMVDHAELFGLRQAWRYGRGLPHREPGFRVRWAYRYVRHPLMAGMLLGLWAAPTLSAGRVMLALFFTAYIAVGLVLEERNQREAGGESWLSYQLRVPALLPRPRRPVTSEG